MGVRPLVEVGGQVVLPAHIVEVASAPEEEDLVVVVVLVPVAPTEPAEGVSVDVVGVPVGEIGRAERAGGGAER